MEKSSLRIVPENEYTGPGCASCPYSFMQRVELTSLAVSRVCKYGPPVIIVIPNPQGGLQMVTMNPPVADDYWCYRHPDKMREAINPPAPLLAG